MNPQILGLRVAGTVFGVMGLVQLTRVITQFEVIIGGHLVPLWLSAAAFVVFSGLCVWLWKLAGKQS